MTTGKPGVATLLFLLGIAVLVYFVIQERNIYDIAYLCLIVIYFVRFLMIRIRH